MNYRGQNLEKVNNNYLINTKYEELFKSHIETLLNIEIDKVIDRYSHYDFKFKNSIIEYKGIYYTLDEVENIAISKDKRKNNIYSVMIGEDKIKHYENMKRKKKDLKIFLFYGFYDIDEEKETIKEINYKYLEISDIINDILTEFNKYEYYNKQHFQIPIKLLKTVDKNIII